MTKAKKLLIGAGVVIVAAVLIAPRYLKGKETIAAAAVPVVSVENPQIGNIELSTALIGTVEPSDMVYVTPKASGVVTEVYVKTGDAVKEGQKLFHIDTKQVDAAKITMDTASVSLKDAKKNLDRMKVLYESGDISQQQYEQAQSSYNLSSLQYKSAKLNYGNQVEFSTVTAPISGVVESFNVEVHNSISPQNAVGVISGEGTRAVSFSVSDRVLQGLRIGDSVTVDKNGTAYQGVVTEVNTMVDPNTGLFKIKAALDQADALATGSQVKLFAVTERADQVMTIPTDSVYYKNSRPNVYLYQDGTVHEVPIETGIYDSEKTEVKSGLTLQDQVIVTWSSELFEGSKVDLQAESQAEGQAESQTESQAESQTESQTESAETEADRPETAAEHTTQAEK